MAGGMAVNAQEYWKMFLETGSPEIYLLFRRECRLEDKHVFDDSGLGTASHGLQ